MANIAREVYGDSEDPNCRYTAWERGQVQKLYRMLTRADRVRDNIIITRNRWQDASDHLGNVEQDTDASASAKRHAKAREEKWDSRLHMSYMRTNRTSERALLNAIEILTQLRDGKNGYTEALHAAEPAPPRPMPRHYTPMLRTGFFKAVSFGLRDLKKWVHKVGDGEDAHFVPKGRWKSHLVGESRISTIRAAVAPLTNLLEEFRPFTQMTFAPRGHVDKFGFDWKPHVNIPYPAPKPPLGEIRTM